MQFELKRISLESIAEALSKVERYRLLNEPNLAESICLRRGRHRCRRAGAAGAHDERL
jgi:hypothetical protein